MDHWKHYCLWNLYSANNKSMLQLPRCFYYKDSRLYVLCLNIQLLHIYVHNSLELHAESVLTVRSQHTDWAGSFQQLLVIASDWKPAGLTDDQERQSQQSHD